MERSVRGAGSGLGDSFGSTGTSSRATLFNLSSMNRERCSELLDLLLVHRGSRLDEGDNFRLRLPYASGSECRHAIERLHEALTGQRVELKSTIFARSKAELHWCGVGRLTFSTKPLDPNCCWRPFDPSAWPGFFRQLQRSRLREVPAQFKLGDKSKGEQVVVKATDIDCSAVVETLSSDCRWGTPENRLTEVDRLKERVRQNALNRLAADQASEAAVDAKAVADFRAQVAADLIASEQNAVLGLAAAAATCQPAAIRGR